MFLQILQFLVAVLNSDENADKVVNFIYEDYAFQTKDERGAVDKYSDPRIRTAVFGGISLWWEQSIRWSYQSWYKCTAS